MATIDIWIQFFQDMGMVWWPLLIPAVVVVIFLAVAKFLLP